jgi:hypothetical protein
MPVGRKAHARLASLLWLELARNPADQSEALVQNRL